ncbi:MAG: NAD-dependent epimerase/dehydratase family protein [Thermomicrobiales bacterium]
MRILLCDIPDTIRDGLARKLANRHDLLSLAGDVRDRDACIERADCDVIIHGLPENADSLTTIDFASRGTWNLLTTTSARRYVFLSSMRMFDAYGTRWHIDEDWAPRPATDVKQLAPYLAEVASREISRTLPVNCVILRLDDVVPATQFREGSLSPIALHVDDAIEAIVGAAENENPRENAGRWEAFHVVRGGAGSRYPIGHLSHMPFAFTPHQGSGSGDATTLDEEGKAPLFPAAPLPLRDLALPEHVVMFGAGGPLGAATTECLKDDVRLLLTDRRALQEITGLPPQSEGAPLPIPVSPPHEERIVDVTDPKAVLAAVAGMDTIVNCTVVRGDPIEAFRVNTLGAFNMMQAAVTAGIRRVVQTGPILTLAPYPAGYIEDRDIGSDLPPRPGDNLYFVSKFLGQEICRIFAEEHAIACPVLLFSGFVEPLIAEGEGVCPGAFTISWKDAGRAMAAATRVRDLPAPFVVANILADAPHDRYRNDAMRTILGWKPEDRLDHLWYRHS